MTHGQHAIAALVAAALLVVLPMPRAQPKVQAQGTAVRQEAGRTPAAAVSSEWVRRSQYVTMRDGTKLALDVYRPVTNGRVVDVRLPVVLQATPYLRARLDHGRLVTPLEGASLLRDLLQQGYIVASLDLRGFGASFGRSAPGPRGDGADISEVVEWLASQPWTNGKVGMYGCSYVGSSQFSAASAGPAHLATVAAASFPLDGYAGFRANGTNQIVFVRNWRNNMSRTDSDGTSVIPPVDEDRDGALLKAALDERRGLWTASSRTATPATTTSRSTTPGPTDFFTSLPKWRVAKTPVLAYGGWFDIWPDQSIAWFRNLANNEVPQRLIMGPWFHCEWYTTDSVNVSREHLRWYDYWLKGVNNGVMSEPPIRYYVMHAPPESAWRSASQWPLSNARRQTFYLQGGKSGTVSSVNDGRLDGTAGSDGKDVYQVDYEVTTTGLSTRYLSGPRGPARNLDTRPIEKRALTYTTPAFARDTEITGFPVVSLWASSTATDQDFFVYLSLVDSDGKSTLVTEGGIRASHRAVQQPPYDNENLPWHGTYKADQQLLKPGEAVKLEFALFPTSILVAKGNRLRLTIANADKDNWDSPVLSPSPTVTVLRDRDHRSSIALPVVSRP